MYSTLEVVVPVIGAKAAKYVTLPSSKKTKIPLESILYVPPINLYSCFLILYQRKSSKATVTKAAPRKAKSVYVCIFHSSVSILIIFCRYIDDAAEDDEDEEEEDEEDEVNANDLIDDDESEAEEQVLIDSKEERNILKTVARYSFLPCPFCDNFQIRMSREKALMRKHGVAAKLKDAKDKREKPHKAGCVDSYSHQFVNCLFIDVVVFKSTMSLKNILQSRKKSHLPLAIKNLSCKLFLCFVQQCSYVNECTALTMTMLRISTQRAIHPRRLRCMFFRVLYNTIRVLTFIQRRRRR